MASTARPAPDGTKVLQRLARLRRRLRWVAILRGVGWLLTVVLVTAVAMGLIDWRWHLPGLVRAMVLVGTLSAAGYIAFRHLFGPLSARADDLTLALRVEDCYPSLNDALASTVQFLGQGSSSSSSPALEREAVRRTLVRAEGIDFNRVVDARGLRTAVLSAGGACALAVALVTGFPGVVGTALARLTNPFGKIEWPRQTRLEIDPPRLRIGRNEAYEVRGKVGGVVPEHATVSFLFEGFPAIEHRCEITYDEDRVARFLTKLDSSRVTRNFRFQVRANDAESEVFSVQVLPPPVLVAINGQPSPQIRLHFPAYTDLPSPQTQTPGTGNVEAVTGTSVTLRAAADRRLRRAWIEYRPDLEVTKPALGFAPLGAANVFGFVASVAGGQAVWQPVPAVLDADPSAFTIRFHPFVNGLYELHFEDETGLAGAPRVYELRLRPDPPPVVNLERPSASRDFLAVLPDATLRVKLTADDTQYAVRSVALEYRTQRRDVPRRLPLYDHGIAGRMLAPLAGNTALATPLKFRPTHLEFDQPLPLKTLTHPDGSPLKEGDLLILQGVADDFDDVTVDKQPGRSPEVEIRIISRAELDVALNQEQAKVQQDLVRLRETEREAMQKVIEVENRLKKGEKPNLDDPAKLLQAEQLQQQITERVGNEKEGLRADVSRILETLKQNGMENSAVRDRMKEVARELERIAEKELRQIEPRLLAARKQTELQEEGASAERRARLEEHARDMERQAARAEQSAHERTADAAKAEQRAGATDDVNEKARQQAEAKRQRQLAEELKQQARDLKEQAEKDRRELAELNEQPSPRQALAEVRQRQEEVEKTINKLLTDMEPWASTREIKGEASRLLQEQRKLQEELENLQKDKEFDGKNANELPARQRAELENAQEAQKRLEDRANQLIDKMKRVADEREDKDPETAKELRGAANQAQQGDIAGQMKAAGEKIRNNQLANAREDQNKAIAELQKLAKNLEDRREEELNRLSKKLKEAEKELAELVRQQEELQKKIKEASQIADPAEREAALKKLAGQQQALQEKSREMVKKLSRLRAERASQALAKGEEAMELSRRQLEKGEKPDENDVLDRLDETQDELEKTREDTEEHLARERLARVAETLKQLRDRQEKLNAETTRLQSEALEKKEWDRALRFSLGQQAEAQKGLGEETAKVQRDELNGTPVFARLLKKSVEAMNGAAERFGQAREKLREGNALPPGASLEERALPLQQEALRRMDQLLEALKPDDDAPAPRLARKNPEGQEGGGGGGGGGGDGGGNQPEGDGLPPVAQLKLLKTMQLEVNQKTEAFRKIHPESDKLTEKERAELQGIRKEQQEVADLLEELTRPTGEPGAAEGEKK